MTTIITAGDAGYDLSEVFFEFTANPFPFYAKLTSSSQAWPTTQGAAQMASSRRPVDVYKEIIDQLVNETTQSVTQKLVIERGFFLKTSHHAVFNELVRPLTPAKRKLLGDMLLSERRSAIHDVLAVLTWWILCGGLAFTFEGEPMPVELSDQGLHGDFIGRLQGWDWPDEQQS